MVIVLVGGIMIDFSLYISTFLKTIPQEHVIFL